METKSTQLQIRVSKRQKRKLREQARAAGMTVSEWLLRLALPPKREELERLVGALARDERRSLALAALHDFLDRLELDEWGRCLATRPPSRVPPPYDALLAAMIEHAASLRGAPVPDWVLRTPPSNVPFLASELTSLRLHLLTSSPPAFRRRNLFVDTSVGGRA